MTLREIFFGSELTVNYLKFPSETTCILNKWHRSKKSIVFPTDVILYLIDHNVLIESSGNFETGEHHYIYNTNLDNFKLDNSLQEELKPVIREIKLNILGININN